MTDTDNISHSECTNECCVEPDSEVVLDSEVVPDTQAYSEVVEYVDDDTVVTASAVYDDSTVETIMEQSKIACKNVTNKEFVMEKFNNFTNYLKQCGMSDEHYDKMKSAELYQIIAFATYKIKRNTDDASVLNKIKEELSIDFNDEQRARVMRYIEFFREVV